MLSLPRCFGTTDWLSRLTYFFLKRTFNLLSVKEKKKKITLTQTSTDSKQMLKNVFERERVRSEQSTVSGRTVQRLGASAGEENFRD